MPDVNGKELLRLSDARFSKKSQLDTLWQTLYDELCPERATFTRIRVDGDEFAQRMYTSLPAQNMRDLAYAIGALTRHEQFFSIKAQQDERNTERATAWLYRAREKQRTLLYTRAANFQSEIEISDMDAVTAGNSVIRHTEDRGRTGIMVFATEHLRDVAWAEDRSRTVNEMHRKYKLALRNWAAEFPDCELPKRYSDLIKTDPHHEIELRHIVMPAEQYDAYGKMKGRNKKPFASIHIDPAGSEVIREGGYFEFPYTVRRWRLAPNTPYASSPAAMLGLVEARLLQAQERVIMDAGERVVDPPSIAVRDAVMGRVNNYAGATTWIDGDHAQRIDDAFKFVDQRANIPIGLELKQDTRQILASAVFLNKLSLPIEEKMTAYEVRERISEFIRSIKPVASPFEVHNAQILDVHFAFNLRVGHFTRGEPVLLPNGQVGPGLRFVPPELRGADIVYEFDGPIQMAYKRLKLIKAQQTRQHAFESMQVRPEAGDNFNFDQIDRDAAGYIDGEPGWLIPEDVRDQERTARAQQAQQQAALEQAAAMPKVLGEAADAVPKLAEANKAVPEIMGSEGGDQDSGARAPFGPPTQNPQGRGAEQVAA